MKPVFFAGGGTLGSVMPLIAVAQSIGIVGAHWIGTLHGPEKYFVMQSGLCQWHGIASGKLRRYASLRNVVDIVFIMCGFFQALFLCVRYRPGCVVVAGGYVGVPVVWSAWILRIPVVVVQLDNAVTLALRLTVPCARVVCVVFPDIVRTVSRMTRARVRSIGIPTLAESTVKSSSGEYDIVIIGGGTGSQALNDMVAGCLTDMVSRAQHGILHVVGKGKIMHGVSHEKYHQVESLSHKDLLAHITNARCVISRSGAGALGDFAQVGASVVLIPLPDSPQESNARYVTAHGAARCIEQFQSAQMLIKAVDQAISDTQIGHRLRTLFPPYGADAVAYEVRQYL